MNFEVNKSYRARGGLKVTIIAVGINNLMSMVGVITHLNGLQHVDTFTKDGKFDETGEERLLDLVAEWRDPIKVSGWVNVYRNSELMVGLGHIHTSRETAKQTAALYPIQKPIACIYVEGIEEP